MSRHLRKQMVLFLTVCSLLFAAVSCAPGEGPKEGEDDMSGKSNPFSTVGYYAFGGVTQAWIDFWKDSGIDTIELLDVGWIYNCNTDALAGYQEKMRSEIELAQQNGIKVYVIFLTNIQQWKGSDATGDSAGHGAGPVFDPNDETLMAERLRLLEDNVKAWSMADGFSLFAGDPGGVSGLGVEGGLSYYLDMGETVKGFVDEHAPKAAFNLNIWAVSQYIRETVNPTLADFWLSEGRLGREIIAMDGLLDSDIGIEIPGHDYYRALALRLYDDNNCYPDRYFPDAQDVQAIQARDVPRYWGFCHFLLDELDDGDSAGQSRTTLPSFNTRYIHKYVQSMREVGMNGLIAGNTTLNNYFNLYAFARFSNDPEATPEGVLQEYAKMLADGDGWEPLFEVLKYLENDTNWHQKLPERERIPLFETTIKSPDEALAALDGIKARSFFHPDYPIHLPESAAVSLSKIRQRVAIMK